MKTSLHKANYRASCSQTALSRAYRTAEVIKMLTNQGLTVIGFNFSGSGQPKIELMKCPKLEQLIKEGRAYYDQKNIRQKTTVRCGHFDVHECHITWTEDL